MSTLSRTRGVNNTLTARQSRPRLTPNLFGICFGIAGLAEAWAAATPLGVPARVPDVLWAVTAVCWAVTVIAYIHDTIRSGRLHSELSDPIFGPFIALVPIVLMLLGVALADYARPAGLVVFAVGLVATVVLGGWLTGQWILADMTLPQWHPGYFLPTVAGGLLASSCSSTLGFNILARMMFGYGVICWLLLGSILLLRLLTQPVLANPLLPTMAIEMAPPVVAGVAWFGINGDRPDGVALLLAGYAVLMGLVQLRLLPAYRTVPFGPGWWSFSFSYAAVFVDTVFWLRAEHVSHARSWAELLLAVVSAGILVLALRTCAALKRGTFLPRPALPMAKEA